MSIVERWMYQPMFVKTQTIIQRRVCHSIFPTIKITILVRNNTWAGVFPHAIQLLAGQQESSRCVWTHCLIPRSGSTRSLTVTLSVSLAMAVPVPLCITAPETLIQRGKLVPLYLSQWPLYCVINCQSSSLICIYIYPFYRSMNKLRFLCSTKKS